MPLAEQISSEAGKWGPLRRPPIYAAASPYGGEGASVAEAARELAGRGAEILLMDCMGFVEWHRREAAAAGLPVILSNSLIAKLVSEIV
ncbi:Protein AroM OS=Bosea thiooxidans OX=53254 GN=ARD30_16645 PE=4 SV=1 [Bosea thiooxidans]